MLKCKSLIPPKKCAALCVSPNVASACLRGLSASVCFNMLKCIRWIPPKKCATLCVNPYLALLYAFIRFHMFSYAFICLHMLSYNFYRLSYAFIRFLFAFIRFYMLLYAFIGQTVRRTTTRRRRDADSLSNRLLPAEAGKKSYWMKLHKLGHDLLMKCDQNVLALPAWNFSHDNTNTSSKNTLFSNVKFKSS